VPAARDGAAEPGGAQLTSGQVASLFRVDVKTVGRWARAGKLPSQTGPDGRRHFSAEAVLARADARVEDCSEGLAGP
jgi:predicted site-specific integrase-resolvase